MELQPYNIIIFNVNLITVKTTNFSIPKNDIYIDEFKYIFIIHLNYIKLHQLIVSDPIIAGNFTLGALFTGSILFSELQIIAIFFHLY
jgi:hypothetical protein